MKLFENNSINEKPLAIKIRPKNLKEFVGQEHILSKNKPLRNLIEKGKLLNCIFFGPPGSGKTTLAEIISSSLDFNFKILNATNCSVSDIKDLAAKAKQDLDFYNKKTVLFLDEIHRFNKLQQDSLLSYTEDGTIILIGATTENPYYNLNNALISRTLIFEFKPLAKDDIKKIILNAKNKINIEIDEEILDALVDISQGDARIAINYLDMIHNIGTDISKEDILNIINERKISFHKENDKYDIISALIKSIRGSDPDSSVYWLARLLYGGEDPRYIARRLFILASEDIGLANPEALIIANAAMQASERIGMPEVRIILAEAVVYLAISTKSNSVYNAINLAMDEVSKGNIQEVPKNICQNNIGYLYPHDYENNFIKQKYMINSKKFYIPGNNRNELLILEKLKKIWR